MLATILLVGGAGYVGSVTAYLLAQQGYQVIILDALTQHQSAPTYAWATFIEGDAGDTALLAAIFSTYTIDAVMHFAAFIEVGESVIRPADFYQNNVVKTLVLFDTMRAYGITTCIFSSTCALYGTPQTPTLAEDHPCAPVSAYGNTKLAVEAILHDYARAYDFRYIALRYFNAAGALPEVGLGEQHEPETHVIPRLLQAIDEQTVFTIFGDDYPTPDGTCLRDYIHVHDLAHAHMLALQHLLAGGMSDVFNVGTGQAVSVKQLVRVAEQVCGQTVPLAVKPRRPGDASALVACSDKIQRLFGWRATYSSLEHIIGSAWQFYQLQKYDWRSNSSGRAHENNPFN